MVAKIISVEPYYFYDPKQEFAIKIDKHLSSFRKQRRGLQNPTKHVKKEIDSTKCSLIKSKIFETENISSDALLPFIDIAMKLQQGSYEAAIETNRSYQLQLLFIFLEAFISIIFNFYYMISVLVEPTAFKLPLMNTIGYLSQHLIQPSVCILVVVLAFSLLKHQFRKSQQIINKIIIHSKDNEMRSRFLAFSQQIQTNIPEFSVFGFFNLDGSVIFSMISAITTYLIILVQALGGESEVDPIFSAYAREMNRSSTHQ